MERGSLPHLDVLHPARRFWGKDRRAKHPVRSGSSSARSLARGRAGDVPGSEIPERYFQFVRSGDARPLAGVLEHNRLDLLSLAGLTARLLDFIRKGPSAARRAREALALGRVYARCGLGRAPATRTSARSTSVSRGRAARFGAAVPRWCKAPQWRTGLNGADQD